MVCGGLSRYAASSRARAFRTSIKVCGNPVSEYVMPVGYLEEKLPGPLARVQVGSCRSAKDAGLYKRWSISTGGGSGTNASIQANRSAQDRKDALLQPRGQVVGATDAAVKRSHPVSTAGPTRSSNDKSSVSKPNAHQTPVAAHYKKASGSIARHITQEITRARTWPDLATITHHYGGARALNEIHLSAALAKLAKMDLRFLPAQPHPQGQQQQQPHQPLSEGSTRPHTGRPFDQGPSLPASPPPVEPSRVTTKRGMYAFPSTSGTPPPSVSRVVLSRPPASALPTSVQGRTSYALQGPLGPLQLTAGASLSAPALANMDQTFAVSAPGLLRPSQAASTVATDVGIKLSQLPVTTASSPSTQGEVRPRLAASPAELCVELLEALARRGGGSLIDNTPPTMSDAAAEGSPTGHNGACPSTGTSHPNCGRPYIGTAGPGHTGGAELAAVEGPAPPQPLPARVLANATWGAARLVMQLWPRHQFSADEVPASPLLARASPAVSRTDSGASGFRSEKRSGQSLGDGATGSTITAPDVPLQRRAWEALRSLLALVVDAAAFMEPQQLSSMLYTVARLTVAVPEVLGYSPGGGSGGSGSGCAIAVGISATMRGVATSAVAGEGAGGISRGDTLAERLVAALLDTSLLCLSSFGPQALSNSLYAVAFLDVSPPERWLQAWLDVAAGQLPRADPQHIANMLWALAHLECDPGDSWVMGALHAAGLKAPAFTTQGLCNTLWALAKLGYKMDSVPKARALLPLVSALGSAARECGGQDVANGMWAIARLYTRLPQPPTPHGTTALSLITPGNAEATHAGGAAAVRDALQAAGRRLLEASSRHLFSYSPQQLANTSWAAAALDLHPPADWEPQFWPVALAALPSMCTEELVATAMATARLRLQPPDSWLAVVLELTSQAILQLSPPKRLPPAAMEAAAASSSLSPRSKTRIQATGRALASILWCVAAWRVRVPVTWTATVLGHLEARAVEGALEPVALATALQAMARMGLRPDAVIAGWAGRVVETVVVGKAAGCSAGAGTYSGMHLASDSGSGGACAPADLELSFEVDITGVGLRPGGCSGSGGGRPRTEEVGALDARCARMLLWSMARLRCSVPDHVAGVLALKASECSATVEPTTTGVATAVAEAAPLSRASGKGFRGLFIASSTTLDATGDAAADTGDEKHGEGDTDRVQGQWRREETSARHVCLVLWALACTSTRPSADVMRQLTRQAAWGVLWASDSELLTIVRSFAVLGFRPGARFRRAVEERVLRLPPRFTYEQGTELLTWCARLRWRLSDGALRALRDLDV